MSEEGPDPLPPRDWTPAERANLELHELMSNKEFQFIHRFGGQLTAEEHYENVRRRGLRTLAALDIRLKYGVEREHLKSLQRRYKDIQAELDEVRWEMAQLEEKIRNRHTTKTD